VVIEVMSLAVNILLHRHLSHAYYVLFCLHLRIAGKVFCCAFARRVATSCRIKRAVNTTTSSRFGSTCPHHSPLATWIFLAWAAGDNRPNRRDVQLLSVRPRPLLSSLILSAYIYYSACQHGSLNRLSYCDRAKALGLPRL
jgi:hypothetical protein